MNQGSQLRYRCHTGHAFTAKVLLAEQTKKLEETLWIALRMFEERRNLLVTLANPASKGYTPAARARSKESQVHIDRLRAILLAGSELSTDLPKAASRSTKG
jgi:two-component system chemotaxis response regulator CheB